MEDHIRQSVTFGLRKSDLDPRSVSKEFGLEPSHSFKKGEQYLSIGEIRHRPFGVWQLRSDSCVIDGDIEAHAQFILAKIEPIGDVIRQYLDDQLCYVDVRIWLESSAPTIGVTLKSSTVRRLAQLCKEFNISFIADGGDEQTEQPRH